MAIQLKIAVEPCVEAIDVGVADGPGHRDRRTPARLGIACGLHLTSG